MVGRGDTGIQVPWAGMPSLCLWARYRVLTERVPGLVATGVPLHRTPPKWKQADVWNILSAVRDDVVGFVSCPEEKMHRQKQGQGRDC